MLKIIVNLLLLSVLIYSKPIYIPDGQCALIVASKKTKSDIQDYIDIHIPNSEHVKLYESKNGWYSISEEFLSIWESEEIIIELKKNGEIPKDSYCSNKFTKYIREVNLDDIPTSDSKINNKKSLITPEPEEKVVVNKLIKENHQEYNTNKLLALIDKLISQENKQIIYKNEESNKIEKKLEPIRKHIVNLENKVDNFNKNITHLQDSIDNKVTNNQISYLKKSLANLKLDITHIKTLITNEKEQNINKTIDSLKVTNSQISHFEKSLNSLKNNVNNLQKISDINLTKDKFISLNYIPITILDTTNISKNIQSFFQDITEESQYDNVIGFQKIKLYIYIIFFILALMSTFFIFKFKNQYNQKEVLHIDSPTSSIDISEENISKLIKSRVLESREKYDLKVFLLKNTLLFLLLTMIYIVIFYFWYSYVYKIDKQHLIENNNYKVKYVQHINHLNQKNILLNLELDQIKYNSEDFEKETNTTIYNFNKNFVFIKAQMRSLFTKKMSDDGKSFILVPKYSGSKSIEIDILKSKSKNYKK